MSHAVTISSPKCIYPRSELSKVALLPEYHHASLQMQSSSHWSFLSWIERMASQAHGTSHLGQDTIAIFYTIKEIYSKLQVHSDQFLFERFAVDMLLWSNLNRTRSRALYELICHLGNNFDKERCRACTLGIKNNASLKLHYPKQISKILGESLLWSQLRENVSTSQGISLVYLHTFDN